MAAEPGRHRLVPDKLDVLVTRETERHDEGPGAAGSAGRVLKERAGAEINLSRFARREAQADRVLWRLLIWASRKKKAMELQTNRMRVDQYDW